MRIHQRRCIAIDRQLASADLEHDIDAGLTQVALRYVDIKIDRIGDRIADWLELELDQFREMAAADILQVAIEHTFGDRVNVCDIVVCIGRNHRVVDRT